MIAEAAIVSFLSPDADERREAAIAKRLDRIDRNVQRLERDIGIANEAFALFIRAWLTSIAPLPDNVQAAAPAKGGERYDKFLEALGRRLAKGPKLRQEIGERCRQTSTGHPIITVINETLASNGSAFITNSSGQSDVAVFVCNRRKNTTLLDSLTISAS